MLIIIIILFLLPLSSVLFKKNQKLMSVIRQKSLTLLYLRGSSDERACQSFGDATSRQCLYAETGKGHLLENFQQNSLNKCLAKA
jgi:hypothetical protein